MTEKLDSNSAATRSLEHQVVVARAPNVFHLAIPSRLVWLVATLLLVFLGQLLQSGVHLNHDVAWMTHSARWLLDGRAFGTEVLDTNLPTAWLPSFPAAALANLGMSEALAVRLTVWAYFLGCAWLSFVLLAHNRRDDSAGVGWKCGVIVAATLLPAFSFGQREHLAVMFAMPYLALAAVRLRGADVRSRWVCVGVGVVAGLGFSIKPYFLAVPLLIEVVLLLRMGWTSWRRPEAIALVATVAAAVIFMIAVTPDYIWRTIPLVRTFYWAYDAPNFSAVLDRYWFVVQPAIFAILISLLTRTWTAHHSTMLIAGLGFSISYLVQAKGFVYHAYPVLVCSTVLLAISVLVAAASIRRHWRSSALQMALVAAITCLALYPVKKVHDATASWYFQHNIQWGPTGRLRQAVIDVVTHYAPGKDDHFFALSTHPFPGYPTASYTKADWSGRTPMQFMIPAYARRSEVSDSGLRREIEKAADLQRQMVLADMTQRSPAVVFVERSSARLGLFGRQFDDIAFYLEDKQFAALWSQYTELAPIGPLRVFVREDVS
jgi:hypothetical protein